MTAGHLLTMTEDQIDYGGLDLDVLDWLVRQEDEPFIATSALATQLGRDPQRAIHVCVEILRRDEGDSHLRAFAMTSLYARAPSIAIAHMHELVHADAPLAPTLLAAMAENVMADVDAFRSEQQLVAKLHAHVRRVPIEELSEPGEVRRFMDSAVASCDPREPV